MEGHDSRFAKLVFLVAAALLSPLSLGTPTQAQLTEIDPGDPPIARQGQPRLGNVTSSAAQSPGDSPLTTVETFAGSVDYVVDGAWHFFDQDTNGTFDVQGLPPGATVLRAWVLITAWSSPDGSVSLDFDGNALPSQFAAGEDTLPNFTLRMHRFDVTDFVPGNGAYPYQATGNTNAYGDAMVVIYEHPDLPAKTLVINDGAEALQMAASTSSFESPLAGSGSVLVMAQGDDADEHQESIRWNGVTVAGPADLFQGGDMGIVSFVSAPVDVDQGPNALELEVDEDLMGFHLAILSLDGVADPNKVVIDFESHDGGALVNGQQVTGAMTFADAVTVDGISSAGLYAAVFDSSPAGPNAGGDDPDLLVDLGNILILQEEPGQAIPGIYDVPDDDRHGGLFTIAFAEPVQACSIDLIDLCPDPNQSGVVVLTDANGLSRGYAVPAGWTEDLDMIGGTGFRTLDLTTMADQPGFVATAIAAEDEGFDSTAVVSIEVMLSGSGAIDNLTLSTRATYTVDFEDLGLGMFEAVHPPNLEGIASSGFYFAPTLNTTFLDIHAGNSLPLWPYNGTTVLAGHDEILMTRVDGGSFALDRFDFSGWLGLEIPFMVVANTGAVVGFTPDGLGNGSPPPDDFETFELPPGFENVTSVLFIHTGPGTFSGSFALDNLSVRAAALTLPDPSPSATIPTPNFWDRLDPVFHF